MQCILLTAVKLLALGIYILDPEEMKKITALFFFLIAGGGSQWNDDKTFLIVLSC